jgi:hypothetical protein
LSCQVFRALPLQSDYPADWLAGFQLKRLGMEAAKREMTSLVLKAPLSTG